MKKLILFLFTIIISFQFIQAKALNWWEDPVNVSLQASTNITFTTENGVYIETIQIDNINIANNTEGIYFNIPFYANSVINYDSNLKATITVQDYMYSDLSLPSDELVFYRIEDGGVENNPYGKYYIETIGLGPYDKNYTAQHIIIKIPLGPTSAPTAEMQDVIRDLTIAYRKTNSNIIYNTKWNLEILPNYYQYIKTSIPYSSDYSRSSIFIPYSKYHIGSYGNYNSEIEYYENDNLICTYDLSSYTSFNTIIDLDPLNNDCNQYLTSINTIRLKILEKPYDLNLDENQYMNDLETKTVVAFNTDLYLINVYNGAQLLKQSTYTINTLTGTALPHFSLPDYPQTNEPNIVFTGFSFIDGEGYRLLTNIDEINNKIYFYGEYEVPINYLHNNVVNIYANFGRDSNLDPTPVTKNVDSNLQTLMSSVGFDTGIGYLIIFFIVIMITNIPLYMIFKNNMVVLIFNTILTSFFVFMGVFSLLTVILLYALLFVLFIKELEGE